MAWSVVLPESVAHDSQEARLLYLEARMKAAEERAEEQQAEIEELRSRLAYSERTSRTGAGSGRM